MRESGNAFLVNGGDVEEGTDNGASIVPDMDSIQEFRLLTNSFDAEYGRFTGAIVNVVTKSGTNAIHGTAYEFLRNDELFLDARNFFDQNQVNPATGQEIPNSAKGAFKQNQFGGGIGAPSRRIACSPIRIIRGPGRSAAKVVGSPRCRRSPRGPGISPMSARPGSHRSRALCAAITRPTVAP